MNTTEMLSILDNAVTAQAKAEQDKRNALYTDMLANIKAAKTLLPELREIAPVANKLTQMGIGNYEYGIWNKFRTDGVSHRWGFANVGPMVRFGGLGHAAKKFVYFGSEAGGYCGSHSLFLNIETGKWTYYASLVGGKDNIGPQMDDEEFARFAASPYIGVMGNIIEGRKYWICNCLGKMVPGINDYIARVQAAVIEIDAQSFAG